MNQDPALEDVLMERFRMNGGRSRTVTFIDEPERDGLFCPIISVDDALEPPSLFVDRLPRKFRDGAPFFSVGDDAVPAWNIEGKRVPVTMTDGAAGRVMSEWSVVAVDQSEMGGVWDPSARLHAWT